MNDIIKNSRIARSCICCHSNSLIKHSAILMPFVSHRVFDWEPVEITDDWNLRTIRKGMAYSICNTMECTDCGVLFLDIRFSESEMSRLYRGYRDEEYIKLREKYEPGYAERNKELALVSSWNTEVEKFIQPYVNFPANILDWGGDTGKNTPFRSYTENIISIYDISDAPVLPGLSKTYKPADQQYDLIICSHVLEHVPYPAQTIVEIKHCMDTNTILYIEVPFEEIMRNSDSKTGLGSKKKHWHEHINFFTQNALETLIQNSGLSILDIVILDHPAVNSTVHLFQVICKLS